MCGLWILHFFHVEFDHLNRRFDALTTENIESMFCSTLYVVIVVYEYVGSREAFS